MAQKTSKDINGKTIKVGDVVTDTRTGTAATITALSPGLVWLDGAEVGGFGTPSAKVVKGHPDDFEDLDDIGNDPLPASDFLTLPLAEQDRLISQAQN